ncbi:MAG: hypothetical protein AAF310_06050 [Myxococcota bacterium]
MAVALHPHSRYTQAALKQLPDGTVVVDALSRRRLDVKDFPQHTHTVRVQPGDTVFSIATHLYGCPRLYWVVCECIHQHNPFLPLHPGNTLTLLTAQRLQQLREAEV